LNYQHSLKVYDEKSRMKMKGAILNDLEDGDLKYNPKFGEPLNLTRMFGHLGAKMVGASCKPD
jgi:hypothetical protein